MPPPPSTPTPTPTPTPAPIPSDLPAGTKIYNYPASNSIDVQKSWLDSPATRVGTYDVLGELTLYPANGGAPTTRATTAGEFTMESYSIVPVQSRFRLNGPAGILPSPVTSLDSDFESSWDINSTVAYHYVQNPYGDSASQDLGERLTATDKATGRQLFTDDFTRGLSRLFIPLQGSTNQLQANLDYDIGYSYVAMGEWSWGTVDINGKSVAAAQSGRLMFAEGDRTPAAGIPVSGTATYDARALRWVKVPFGLIADFGQRTISARIDQDYQYNPAGDSMDYPNAFGFHVGGSAPFTNSGSFDIPLSGTANFSSSYAFNTLQPPPSEPVTGELNGAFFGPHAEQVGGVLGLQRANGDQLIQDAFVGKQRP